MMTNMTMMRSTMLKMTTTSAMTLLMVMKRMMTTLHKALHNVKSARHIGQSPSAATFESESQCGLLYAFLILCGRQVQSNFFYIFFCHGKHLPTSLTRGSMMQ